MSQHEERKNAHCAGTSDFLEQSYAQSRQALLDQIALTSARSPEPSGPEASEIVKAMVLAAFDEDEAGLLRAVHGSADAAHRAGLFVSAMTAVEARREAGQATLIQTIGAMLCLRRALESARSHAEPPLGDAADGSVRAIIYVAPEDPHTLGAFAVTDRMTAAGVDVYPMVHAPKESLFEILAAHPVDVLAISVGYDQSFEGLADFIDQTRIVSTNRALSVMLGGAAFDQPKDSYTFLGADVIMAKGDDHSQQAFRALFAKHVS